MENAALQTHMLLPIEEIARKLSLLPAEYEPIGAYGAKLNLDLLQNPAFPVRGKLIIVTATTPTTAGEGKTVVSIGLAQGLPKAHPGCESDSCPTPASRRWGRCSA